MDAERFETLLRSLSEHRSRRGALRLLAGSALGSLLGWRESGVGDAHDLSARCKKRKGDKKKRCLKRARKHNAEHAGEPPRCPAERACAEACCASGQICKGGTECCTEDQAAFCAPPGEIRCGPWDGPCGRRLDCGSCPVGTGIEACINGVCQD
jgi:hypothetical protein